MKTTAPNPSTPEATRPAPFDLPLQRGGYGDDIIDAAGNLTIQLYGDERVPETLEQRDYLIRAVNSYDDMLAALKAMVADDAFVDLCQGIGHEPEWLKSARLAISKAESGQ